MGAVVQGRDCAPPLAGCGGAVPFSLPLPKPLQALPWASAVGYAPRIRPGWRGITPGLARLDPSSQVDAPSRARVVRLSQIKRLTLPAFVRLFNRVRYLVKTLYSRPAGPLPGELGSGVLTCKTCLTSNYVKLR